MIMGHTVYIEIFTKNKNAKRKKINYFETHGPTFKEITDNILPK